MESCLSCSYPAHFIEAEAVGLGREGDAQAEACCAAEASSWVVSQDM